MIINKSEFSDRNWLKDISLFILLIFALLTFYIPPRYVWAFFAGSFFIISETFLWLKFQSALSSPTKKQKIVYFIILFILKFPVLYGAAFLYCYYLHPPAVPIFVGLSFPISWIIMKGLISLISLKQGVEI